MRNEPSSVAAWVAENVEMEGEDDMSPVAMRKVTVRLPIGMYAALRVLADSSGKSPTGAAGELLVVAVREAVAAAGIPDQLIDEEFNLLML